jgi:predicted DsbA family dithiol-disulfide isomerase
LKRIESSAFSSSSLRSITLPRSVEWIDGSSFAGLDSLTILLESGHEHYSVDHQFLYSSQKRRLIRCFSTLSTIVIPSGVEILCSECFSSCKSLETISFESPSSLKRIESYTFSSSSLRSIIIPSGVEILCSQCFSSCQSLETISFESPSSLKRIESSAFRDSSLRSITLPRSVEWIDDSAFAGLDSLTILLESGNEHYSVDHQFLYSSQKRRLIRCFSTLSMIVIPSGVEILCSQCFLSCQSLETISFESPSLKRIESFAFRDSSLRSITLPRSVECIDDSAFAGLDSLTIANDSVDGHSPPAGDFPLLRGSSPAQRPLIDSTPPDTDLQ